MKAAAVFVLTIFTQFVFCQTNWQDNFSDSNFYAQPTWTGDTSNFIVNPAKQLQLAAAPVTSSQTIGTPSTCGIDGVWEFWLKLDFNPSANNYSEVYLLASGSSVTSSLGYFVRVGGTSEDRISLFRKDATTETLLAQTPADYLDATAVNVRIQVIRSTDHTWQLLADSTGGTSFQLHGSATDSTYLNSAYFLWRCVYTSTRSTKFFLDDIQVNGNAFQDNNPPKIVNSTIPKPDQIEFTFSEPVDSASARKVGNYLLDNGSIQIAAASWVDSNPIRVTLNLQNPLASTQDFTVFAEGVEDQFGNEMADSLFTLSHFRPAYREVVFNEIMADPTPLIGLPETEFLELKNNTSRLLQADNWRLVATDDTFTLASFAIAPEGYHLIISTSAGSEYDSLNPTRIPTGNSWLTNTGEPLVLLDSDENIIDAVHFAGSWLSDAKSDGGWSLSQISSALPCSDRINWSASNSPLGGTPGFSNQPEFSTTFKQNEVSGVFWHANNLISFAFTHGLSPQHLPKITSNTSIDSTWFYLDKPTQFFVTLQNPLSNQPVSFYIHPVAACQSTFGADTITLSAISMPEEGDLVINEILFNPQEDRTEFIEIWNTSAKTLLFDQLRLLELENGLVTGVNPLASGQQILLPKTIIAISEDVTGIANRSAHTKARNFLMVDNLPSLPNAEGEIGLGNANLAVFEQVAYAEHWHHPSISNAKGVSLERIDPNLSATEQTSWHSASSASGFSTPGLMNSQFSSTNATKEQFSLDNTTVSPNNDGWNDVLILNYKLPQGAVLTATIYNTRGNKIASLAQNQLTEVEGKVVWNGKDQSGTVPPTGAYIILAEWFEPGGASGQAKLTFALQK